MIIRRGDQCSHQRDGGPNVGAADLPASLAAAPPQPAVDTFAANGVIISSARHHFQQSLVEKHLSEVGQLTRSAAAWQDVDAMRRRPLPPSPRCSSQHEMTLLVFPVNYQHTETLRII